MKISLDYLKTFITFHESKNVFETAEKLGLSQPSVSVQLKALEDFMEKPLFSIKGKKKVLNPFGEALYKEIVTTMKTLEDGLFQVKNHYQDLTSIQLKIAGRREIMGRIIDLLIFPGKVTFELCGNVPAIEKLMDHEIDMAIIYNPPVKDGLICKKLFSDSFCLAIPKSLLKITEPILESLDKKQITKLDYISYKNDFSPYAKVAAYYKLANKDLNIRYVIEDWYTIIEMCENGLGAAIIPISFKVDDDKVLKIPIPKNIIKPIDFFAVYQEDRKKLFPLKEIFDLSKS